MLEFWKNGRMVLESWDVGLIVRFIINEEFKISNILS
jgi:hypothetical protein